MTLARLIIGLTLLVGSLTVGWWLHRRKIMMRSHTSWLVEFVVKYLAPCVLCLSLWQLELPRGRLWILPTIGIIVAAAQLLAAWLYAKPARFTQPQIGSFLTCACFSNVGYLGAFTAFVLYGEAGFALSVLYFLFFSPGFFTLGFGLAKHYGRRTETGAATPRFADDLRLYPSLGMVVGLLLNVYGVPRPALFAAVNTVLIPVDTALYLVAIGSQLTIAPVTRWVGPSLVMSGLKFLLAPAIAWALVTAFGLEGLPRFVALLLASTPVAVSPLVLPLLFGLDRQFSNALWLFTSLLAIPWWILIVPLLQRL